METILKHINSLVVFLVFGFFVSPRTNNHGYVSSICTRSKNIVRTPTLPDRSLNTNKCWWNLKAYYVCAAAFTSQGINISFTRQHHPTGKFEYQLHQPSSLPLSLFVILRVCLVVSLRMTACLPPFVYFQHGQYFPLSWAHFRRRGWSDAEEEILTMPRSRNTPSITGENVVGRIRSPALPDSTDATFPELSRTIHHN